MAPTLLVAKFATTSGWVFGHSMSHDSAEKAAILWFSGSRTLKPSMSSVCFMTAWIWRSICRIECRLLINNTEPYKPTTGTAPLNIGRTKIL